jgi:hypothetical protein
MPIFLERYLIWIMPAFIILSALGIAALARSSRVLGAVALAALLTFNVIGLGSQYSQPIKADFRLAVGDAI